jgi:hypothetical protein
MLRPENGIVTCVFLAPVPHGGRAPGGHGQGSRGRGAGGPPPTRTGPPPGHPPPAGYFGNQRTGHDFHDGVITLLHDAHFM